MNPLVSVIVPNFNHAAFLEKRIESILNQTYSNIEVILLDDCSSDKSVEILSKYAENAKVSQCVFNEINSGNTFLQWHKGIQLAKGDFIWIAESDDYSEPDFIEKVVAPLISDESIVLSYSQSNKVNELNEVTGSWREYTLNLDESVFDQKFVMNGNTFTEKYLIHKNVIPNASAVIFRNKGNILTDFITLNKEFRYCGDWIFYFKLILDHKIAFIPEGLNNFRYHNKSVIAKAKKADNAIRLIDLDIMMRLEMNKFLYTAKPSNYNNILAVNSKILKQIKYDKALLLFEDKKYFKSFSYFITTLEVPLNRNRYIRRFKKKMGLLKRTNQ